MHCAGLPLEDELDSGHGEEPIGWCRIIAIPLSRRLWDTRELTDKLTNKDTPSRRLLFKERERELLTARKMSS